MPSSEPGATSPLHGRLASGFTLIEVIVATLIATIAVIGMAYTFSTGRGFIDRFAIQRAALAAAEGRLDSLSVMPAALGPDSTLFVVDGRVLGVERWTIAWRDVPGDSLAPEDLNPNDLKFVDLEVAYRQGTAIETIRLSRLLSVR